MLPRSHALSLTSETVVLIDSEESYLGQQVAKLNADLHTQADYIVHIDSDCVFTKPITPDYFFHGGLPLYAITPFHKASKDEQFTWLHVMTKAVRQMPPYEFMRRNCIIYPRFIYQAFREFMQFTHGMTMEQYVMSQPGNEFSEFNCLGFFAWLNYRDAFHWHNTETDGVPEWPWRQFWSWQEGGVEPSRKELEEICA